MAEFVYQMYKACKAVGEKVILMTSPSAYTQAQNRCCGSKRMGKPTLLKVISWHGGRLNGEAKLTLRLYYTALQS